MHLVLIETSGNQSYIFASNKLREHVGASELTYRAGTQWVLEAVYEAGGPKLWDEDVSTLRDKLLDDAINKPVSDINLVEVLVSTSGKALLLVNSHEIGKQIVANVTKRAINEAPGMHIIGVVGPAFSLETSRVHAEITQVHELYEEERAYQYGPEMRFGRIPIIAECSSSGAPAYIVEDKNDISKVTKTKGEWRDKAYERFGRLLSDKTFSQSLDQLSTPWQAVVHADGNGLGQLFMSFDKCIEDALEFIPFNRNYINKLRAFSIQMDICTEEAFKTALKVFGNRPELPVVPLIVGGDDLTIVCDGEYALKFTNCFLTAFEKQTQNNKVVKDVIGDYNSKNKHPDLPSRLSSCAGVAIVKPHFPFATAYGLAADLIKQAKTVKKLVKQGDQPYPCSALDFHILYDSSVVDLEAIRTHLEVDSGSTRLHGRPLIVTPTDGLPNVDWVKHHRWSTLLARAEALLEKDENNKRCLPNSQMHQLRSDLFGGKEFANHRYKLIRQRYAQNLGGFEGKDHTLFWEENADGKTISVTALIDAIDIEEFIKGECCKEVHNETES